MSTKKKHSARPKRSGALDREVRLPGTLGETQPARAIALLTKWSEEGDAEEDRRAYEAIREETERARS
jgi:hypothetical protein